VNAEALFALLRRRGFLWPTAELYGGSAGLYDYGPLGAAVKRRIEEAWTAWFVGLSDDYYLIEPPEILPESVLKASGHVENFTDPEVSCGRCHAVFRADSVLERWRPDGVDGLPPEAIGALLAEHHVTCPSCGAAALTVPRPFNLMFGLELGVQGAERGYLRPETAQNSFLAFPRMWEIGRRALPLGIGVIGRAYRNEIAPRQVLYRMRAFTQAELQIFFDPAAFPVPLDDVAATPLPVVRAERRLAGDERVTPTTAAALVDGGLPAFYVYHLAQLCRFATESLGLPADGIRLLEKSDAERAFYNRIQFDLEASVESLGGFREIGALHYRGDYDLARHAAGAKKDLSVAPAGGGRVLPHVLEVTHGIDRSFWAVADRGLRTDGDRTVWGLPAFLAPFPVGVLPLLKKPHGDAARGILEALRAEGIDGEYDDAASIGRRYARLDEAGVPFAVTVDGSTLDPADPAHGTVTLRERDSRAQRRVGVPELVATVRRARRPPRARPAAPVP